MIMLVHLATFKFVFGCHCILIINKIGGLLDRSWTIKINYVEKKLFWLPWL